MSDDRWDFLAGDEVHDVRVIVQALVDGPWLQNRSAFWARLVHPREQVESKVAAWPASDLPPIVIRRALSEVCQGIRVSDESWNEHFGAISRQRVEQLYALVKSRVDKLGNWVDS